jgi:hypothetical protein
MAFQLKSFKELVSMTKEKLEETMIPLLKPICWLKTGQSFNNQGILK